MNIDVRVVDISDQLQSHRTFAMVKRTVADGHLATAALVPGSCEPYQILTNALDQGEPKWSIDKGGSHVAVPLFPYTFASQAELLVKFGLEFGAFAAIQVPHPDKVLMVMSTIFARPDNEPGYCVYVGVAIRQES